MNRILVMLLLITLLLSAAPLASAQTELSLWYHGAGNLEERAVLLNVIDDFNASQSDWSVVMEEFPQESYESSVVAAALSGDLPDIIDVNGPVMPDWAWSGYMAPLNLSEGALDVSCPALSASTTANSMPSVCGTLWSQFTLANQSWKRTISASPRSKNPGPAKNLTPSWRPFKPPETLTRL